LMYICRYRVQSPCHCYLLGNRELWSGRLLVGLLPAKSWCL
jgi:hypothetical protein